MMKLSLLLILLCGITADIKAHADDLIRVDSLRLVGRGIQSKKTEEYIALSCDVETCEEFRFVFVDQYKQAFYLSEKFYFTAQERDQLKKALRYVKRRSTSKRNQHITLGAAAAAFAVPFVAPVGVGVSVGGMAISAAWFLTQDAMAMSFDNDYSLTNQNGWNWSVQPKRIGDGVFQEYRSLVTGELNPRFYSESKLVH